MKTCLGFALFALATSAFAAPPSFDTEKIEKIVGVHGTYNESEGVFKVSRARNEVGVTVDGRPMDPFQGLTSWIAFKKGASDLMIMGDLVLFQDEVNPAMSEALARGLEVTALHNHFFYDEPKVYFMHVAGEGNLESLSQGVRKVWDKVAEIRATVARPTAGFGGEVSAANAISAQPLEKIFGQAGTAKDGMFKVVFGRTATMACGCEVGKEMGVNTWAAFAGSDEQALVDGDFVFHESELQPILKSLRQDGINIVAIHHHMTGEQPRSLFLHYWGKGTAVELATAVKRALAITHQ